MCQNFTCEVIKNLNYCLYQTINYVINAARKVFTLYCFMLFMKCFNKRLISNIIQTVFGRRKTGSQQHFIGKVCLLQQFCSKVILDKSKEVLFMNSRNQQTHKSQSIKLFHDLTKLLIFHCFCLFELAHSSEQK